MINAKLQNLYNIKNDIGTAIVNKGGTITESTPFYSYAGQIDSISTGTPQTVFQDSTGAKWAFTNTVNLTNDSGNVTHDFNWLQPANASTSDPILTGGTVGANISGNIRLVPVNQVNIAQYSNIVINDTTGAKYVGYNGYDQITNPTPTGNTTFNRWLLNNSASGTVIFANATIVNGGTYNGSNSFLNEANMSFVGNTPAIASADRFRVLGLNNSFVYGGVQFSGLGRVAKFHEGNLAFIGVTTNIGDVFPRILTNNGFLYAYGGPGNEIRRFFESNLVLSGSNSASYQGGLSDMVINNGRIITSGNYPSPVGSNRGLFVLQENSFSLSTYITNNLGLSLLAVNNGFIYAIGAETNRSNVNMVRKFHESNLVLVGNTPEGVNQAYTGLAVNNGFIYMADNRTKIIVKFGDSNFSFIANSPVYNNLISGLIIKDGFIYISSFASNNISKYHEGNLAFVSNASSPQSNFTSSGSVAGSIVINNGSIFAAGSTSSTNARIGKFTSSQFNPETLTFYTATKIKE
jgi:hypothetical protein